MKPFFTFFLAFTCIAASAQLSFKKISSKIPAEKILYIGVDNRIVITGSDKKNKYVLLCTSCTISEYEDFFNVTTNIEGYDTLRLLENGKIILQEIFDTKPIPSPVVILANSIDTVLTKMQIKVNPTLSVLWPNSNYYQPCLVRNFTARTIDSRGIATFSADIFGNTLSKDLLSAINKLDNNSSVIFEDILVVCANCLPRRMGPIVIKIRIR